MRLLYLILFIATSVSAAAQCLTDFTKLVPEPTQDITQQYGRISMFDNYLAIGLPDYDSLGRLSGVVKIFEKSGTTWKNIATLAPSDPRDAVQFGSAVKLSSNYLLVAGNYYSQKVYVFKKGPDGWQSQTELTSFTAANGRMFGTPYQTQNTIAISDDEQTIAVTDIFYGETSQELTGAIFVYHKQPAQEWNSMIAPVIIRSPETDAVDFGRAGVVIRGDRIITGTPFAPTGNGRLYIFRDATGEFLDLELEAKLSAYASDQTGFLGYNNFAVTPDGIFTTITTGINSSAAENVMAFYEMPASGIWQDMNYTCVFPYHETMVESSTFPVVGTNGDALIVSSRHYDGTKTGYTTLLRKGPSGWCSPVRELVDVNELAPGQVGSAYAAMNAINQSEDIAVALLPHPNVVGSNLALKIISKNASNEWEGTLLASHKKSSAGHWYGRGLLGFEDYMVVGASGDGSIKPNGGAVYIYKKSGTSWNETAKILAPVKNQYDDVFGSALATNGHQLAVGAVGFEDHGRVFIYEKTGVDWSMPELVQEIILPEDILTVYSYGDNLAMNDEWLLIPYVQNSPARVMLAIYRHDGNEWKYNQVVEIGMGNFFARETTLAVAIEDHTVLAGNVILELDNQGTWHMKYFLSPSDPEPMQIAPDFSHWITNGSSFGQSVAISNNTIFIGAPTKDDGATWDVGAIYVYTKKPWESWSNRTESAKILPRIRNERELFGYSIKALGNTLIAGAPGADFNKDGTARNKPGRVYIFQTEDYFWSTITPLLDLTGDSFVKDYFGIAVNLDETDFFIGAPIEDLETGKLSGSVYVTPAPPIIKLVPPVCSSSETIQLFGYPFGGTWTGPGLLDGAQGVFDPKAAGIGEHEFTYTTASCTYVGRLRISVEEPVIPSLLVKSEHVVCQNASVQIPLSIESKNGYQYLWYHRDDVNEPFFPLNQRQASMIATMRGEYKVKMSNTVCAAFSSSVTIKNDSVDLELTPIARICQDPPGGLQLTATPAGGQWSGTGVTSDGRLQTLGISNGPYTLRYQYVSQHQCTYSEVTQYEVDRPAKPIIARAGGNLCQSGEVKLAMTSAPESNTVYTWARKENANSGWLDFNAGVAVTVKSRGVYVARAEDGDCTVSSNEIVVDDNTFKITMWPADKSIVSCNNIPFELTISPDHVSYKWYLADDENAAGTLIYSPDHNSLNVTQSGYYYAVVRSGICEQVTPRKHVTIRPTDELFVPNVFTPNGDTFNDVFEVRSTVDIVRCTISNRYGKTVYSSGPEGQWNGEGHESGVYYWHIIYKTCAGQTGTAKGYVHLIK